MKLYISPTESLALKIRDYRQNILINYDLVELSDNKYISVDRGALTDRYESTLTFSGNRSDMSSLYNTLYLIRQSKSPIILTDIDVPIFGDHIIYPEYLSTIITKITQLENKSTNIYSFELTLLCSNDSITFGVSPMPKLTNLRNSWSGSRLWNFKVTETYNRINTFYDSECDRYTFTGEYLLTKENNNKVYTYWRNIRGSVITINESDWGITDMFGLGIGHQTTHNVVIKNIEYDKLGNIYRLTKITLYKVV